MTTKIPNIMRESEGTPVTTDMAISKDPPFPLDCIPFLPNHIHEYHDVHVIVFARTILASHPPPPPLYTTQIYS